MKKLIMLSILYPLSTVGMQQSLVPVLQQLQKLPFTDQNFLMLQGIPSQSSMSEKYMVHKPTGAHLGYFNDGKAEHVVHANRAFKRLVGEKVFKPMQMITQFLSPQQKSIMTALGAAACAIKSPEAALVNGIFSSLLTSQNPLNAMNADQSQSPGNNWFDAFAQVLKTSLGDLKSMHPRACSANTQLRVAGGQPKTVREIILDADIYQDPIGKSIMAYQLKGDKLIDLGTLSQALKTHSEYIYSHLNGSFQDLVYCPAASMGAPMSAFVFGTDDPKVCNVVRMLRGNLIP